MQGRTDNLIIDEGCREMLDISIECYIDCRIGEGNNDRDEGF